MPVLKCLGCGFDTNTTTCDYIDHDDHQPRKCYVRWNDGVPEKGCGFDAMATGGKYEQWYKIWCEKIFKKGEEK